MAELPLRVQDGRKLKMNFEFRLGVQVVGSQIQRMATYVSPCSN